MLVESKDNTDAVSISMGVEQIVFTGSATSFCTLARPVFLGQLLIVRLTLLASYMLTTPVECL